MKGLVLILAFLPIAIYGQTTNNILPALLKSKVAHLPKLQTQERWAARPCNLEFSSIRVVNYVIRPGGCAPIGCAGPRRHFADTISRIEAAEPFEYYRIQRDCQYLVVRNPTSYNNIDDWIAVNTTIYQSQRGAPFLFSGGRPGEILYIIDRV